MPKHSPKPDEYDSPWKQALQVFLRAFLEFYFPDIAADIDWARGYESLDKELNRIARRAKVGKRLADKLFKVWLKNGAEHWILIHIEIQREFDPNFAERMFQYNIAAYQMYNRHVVSLAALCDDRHDWRPTTFQFGLWGSVTGLTFRIAKLLDFAAKVEELEASGNPFAAVTLADCKARETQHDPMNRMIWKLRVVKGLYQRNWTKEQIVLLFVLIDEMMGLPPELDKSFDDDLTAFEEEKHVRYVSSVERLGYERGIEKGREEGLAENLAVLMKAKFGAAGLRLLPKVQSLRGEKELRMFFEFAITAKSVKELRDYLSER